MTDAKHTDEDDEDTVETVRGRALWGHIMDERELDRLGEVLTEDAER